MSASSERAALLAVLEEARRRGFLGPGPVDEHVRQAERFRCRIDDLLVRGALFVRAVDLGSGGGVPGLALAVDHPELTWVLVEAGERRAAFLQEAVSTLGLADRVSVRWGRAELLARDTQLRHQIDLVVVRSFGPPAVTAECATGFLRQDGYLLVSEPPYPQARQRWPAEELAELGFEPEGVTHGIQALRQARLCPERFPRRVGIPAKRPLFH
ncbi:RsmG family class I SAM-dependent methyltransferase [Rhabdothermincola sediminis]|uniref:RsmG family class I SAM-dependent methyltransferase n=1 Tax=Rhabdothermincola sediminis TaxID=2751370 RepID=UPI001AA03AAB|nr:RsmG family class I SAM-dependent methyltransferase [Rhabdothermincola sediminis]